ncbi:caspase domain-containing protein [Xylaria digitata]|nr:caspase domain-containing protein [Xylaria digitata]
MATASKPRIWAVLVGINFYVEKVNRLKGAVNDVGLFEKLLKSIPSLHDIQIFTADITGDDYQSQPIEDPKTWPTYDNIITALKNIVKSASPGDHFHFHFSGHGTKREKSEHEYQDADGADAALVLFDDSTSTKARYFRGIELANILDGMLSNKLVVSLVLDCCHSGSVSRDASGTRCVPWDDVTSAESPINVAMPQLRQTHTPSRFRDGDADNHWLLTPENYALITACGSHERTKEITVNQRSYGALSWHFLEAIYHLDENDIQRSYKNVIHRVRARLRVLPQFDTQNPLLMGTDSMIFESSQSTRHKGRATCEVVSIIDDKAILNVGYIHGVREGDEYTLMNAAAPDLLLVITEVYGISSLAGKQASQRSQSHSSRLEIGLSATLTRVKRPKAQVRLLLDADHHWEDMDKRSSWVQFVQSTELVPGEVPCFSVIHNDQDEFEIINTETQAGMNMPSIPSADVNAIEKTITLLEHLAKFFLTSSLENKTNEVLDERAFRIELPNAITTSAGQNELLAKDGDIIPIIVHNNTSEHLYCTVLNLRPLRQITRIPKDKEYKIVEPKRTSTTKIKMSISQSLRDRGIREATDIFKFIITTRPIRVAGLTLPDPETVVRITRGTDDTRGTDESNLDGLLQGKAVYENPPDDLVVRETIAPRWTCYSVYIHTRLGSS